MGLKLTEEDGILFVEIDNAEAGYSFGPLECKDLIKALKSTQIKNIEGIVWRTPLSGIFCSGGNLKHYSNQKSRNQGLRTNREISKALLLLAQAPVPTVAVVDGDCYGGGLELASCFDYVIATPKSFFGLWQRRIGLSFGWGGGARLSNRMGLKKLRVESLLARSFSCYEAIEMGLVDKVVIATMAKDLAKSWIQKSNMKPKAPFSALKSWIPQKEKSIIEKLWFNKEHLEVLKKFKNSP